MPRPDFDAVIAGAGAAGAAAAYHLTQAGLKTLVVDKARLPRYKPCGGAIPRTALECFPFDFGDVIESAPAQAWFTFPRLPQANVALPTRPVVMVRRARFDAFLLSQSGAEVLPETPVTDVAEDEQTVRVRLGERTVTARYLVAADGAVSQAARCLKLRHRRWLGGTLEAEVSLKGNPALRDRHGHGARFLLGVIPWGYAWVFPKADVLSVGICRLRPGRANLRQLLQREMDRLGIPLGGVQLHGHPLPSYQAPPWPFWDGSTWSTAGDGPQERLSTRRCVLVGDAAGLVDPFLGEGIRYAMASARLASEAIAGDDLSGYERAVWREIGHSLATAGLLASLFYSLTLPAFAFGAHNPAVVRQFVDLFGGHFTYAGIGRRIAAATILWPLMAVKKRRRTR